MPVQADPLCSFGDFVAVSDEVDIETAKLLKIEVSITTRANESKRSRRRIPAATTSINYFNNNR